VLHCSVHNVPGCPLHGVVKAGVDNVLLRGSGHLGQEFLAGGDGDGAPDLAEPLLQGVLNRLEEMVVSFPLILEGQTSVGDVIEILQPLEVGHSDTTSVDVHVRDDEAALVLEDLVRCGGDGSISSLSDDPGLDLVGVALVDGLFHGGGDQDVAGLVHDVLPGVGLSPGEAHDGAVLQLVVLQGLGVNAVLVVDAAVPLGDTNTGGPGPGEVAACVEADVTEALDDVSLAAPAGKLPIMLM